MSVAFKKYRNGLLHQKRKRKYKECRKKNGKKNGRKKAKIQKIVSVSKEWNWCIFSSVLNT
jgi:hypothetical protein